MKKNNLLIRIGLVTLLCAGSMYAREFRTPSPFYNNRFNHYPLPWPTSNDSCWSVQVWGAGLHRDTDRAFVDKNSTDKESLAGIFFNANSFLLLDAFAPGSFDPANPLAGVFLITPNFDYRENTAFFGFTLDRTFGCENQWHAGLRVQIPYRSIKTELDNCCELSETIEDVRRLQREHVVDEFGETQVVEDAFAYRLDFLSALPLTVNAPIEMLVNYSDPISGHVTINNIDVTDFPADPLNKNPIHLIQIDNGTIPPAPFTLRQTSNVGGESVLPTPGNGTGLPFLGADGSGPGDGLRARFNSATNYTPLATNLANQSRLWVVPTGATQPVVSQDPGNQFGLVPAARSIETITEQIIRGGLTAPIDFLLANGITFDTQRSVGIGDLDTELYLRYYGCDYRWVAEADFGVRFPTGKRNKLPGRLLFVPTGNNHHYEIKLGGLAGWMPCDWFGVTIDSFYSFVLKSNEKVAASFLGATVKNIGPTIDADVRWGYYVGNIDFTFMVPCDCWRVGIDVGYQAYVKQKDHIRFDSTTAVDLFGVTQTLDPNVLERRTDQVAHKIKTEIFHRGCNWQICAGWQHVFAGKNATHDTDWYLGLSAYF